MGAPSTPRSRPTADATSASGASGACGPLVRFRLLELLPAHRLLLVERPVARGDLVGVDEPRLVPDELGLGAVQGDAEGSRVDDEEDVVRLDVGAVGHRLLVDEALKLRASSLG